MAWRPRNRRGPPPLLLAILGFKQIPELYQCLKSLLKTPNLILRSPRQALPKKSRTGLRGNRLLNVQERRHGLLYTGDQARDGEAGPNGPRRLHPFQARPGSGKFHEEL